MTDAQLRDAAVAELKLTTAGWRKANGNPNYPSGTAPPTTHWGKAMALLDQIGQVAPPPPPPPAGTWDEMLAREFPRAAFTPLRIVPVTSASQLSSAIANIRPGDKIEASGFTLPQVSIRDKNLSDWAEIHFTNVKVVGTGTADVFVFWNSSKIRCFGADVSKGGYGVRMYDSVDVEFRGTVHDVGATGVHVIPTSSSYGSYRSPTRCVVVAECWNCGLDWSTDPHAEKGTGLHAGYVGKSGSLPNIACRYAIDSHDQPRCGGDLQITNHQDSVFAVRARNLTFVAQSQTAGNVAQHFGSASKNCRFVHLEGHNITGKGLSSIGGLDTSSVVEYGRLTDYLKNPHEGTNPWAPGPRYLDVQP